MTLLSADPRSRDALPEQRLAVAMVAAAAQAATAGDPEAVRWLRLCGRWWLELICDQADPEAVLDAVLRRCDP